MLTPRPYQREALDALHQHVCTRQTNPCVVLPTGSGKSVVMAWAIARWQAACPAFRCCILAHRKELVEQNVSELRAINPNLPVGVFSAGLERRDWDAPILYASIDSIYRRAGEFAPWDCIFVDEAHRIPMRGEGKYRKFLLESQIWNPDLRVVGWTATPYRMGTGHICHHDHILHEVCYEAHVADLIRDGYLCRLRSKVTESQIDTTGIRKVAGDYQKRALSAAATREGVVQETVAEAVRIMDAENRQSAIVFAIDLHHAALVRDALARHGIRAPAVTNKTRPGDRDRIVDEFKAGRHRALVNVNVYTEGFNAKRVDCIALLRPTLSAGLFAQMVGRGLRQHPNKADCLVLDFAGCIDTHGPLDQLGQRAVPTYTCPECREVFSRAVRTCPACGWTIPKREIERIEAAEKRERAMHASRPSDKSILSGEPETYPVHAVTVSRHRKPGSPDSLRVEYRSGLARFREWVCLDHGGTAEQLARQWWAMRFGAVDANRITVNQALTDLFLSQKLADWTKTVTVQRQGKFFKIIGHNRPLHTQSPAEAG